MLAIDGSAGEGGGQILRTAIGLSLVTQTPVRVERIRSSRGNAGLRRQHQVAVLAAEELCGARVSGNEIESEEVTFEPGPVRSGRYFFEIGTAGSATLVFQTVLPALLRADGPTTIVIEGGTHNPMAPPADFVARAFLPLVRRMGPDATATLDRYGFHPAGGGRISFRVEPSAKLAPLVLEDRGALREIRARAIVARLPRHVAERELGVVGEEIGLAPEAQTIVERDDSGPGNALVIDVESEHVTEVFTGFGRKGVPAEEVADGAVEEVERYMACSAPVGPYLADQLVVLLGLARAGSFVTSEPSAHTLTNVRVVEQMLGVRFEVKPAGEGVWRVRVV